MTNRAPVWSVRNGLLCIATLFVALIQAQAAPPQSQSEKPRLAIYTIDATPAVRSAAERSGQVSVLDQILQGSNSLLTTSLTKTGRFDIVSRTGLQDVIDEQDFGQSGNVDLDDPQAAQTGQLAGAAYVAQVTVDNYQDITKRMVISGRFGDTPSERREIQLQATLKIIDATSGVITNTETISIQGIDMSEVLPGESQDGRSTNALIGDISRRFAERSANAILNLIAPAKVIGYSSGQISFNRGEGTGVSAGQIWEVLFPGEPMIDPDTGENLGAEEIHIGWAVVESVLPKFSKARAVEDFGIDRTHIMRWYSDGDRIPPGVDPNQRLSGSASGDMPGRTGGGGAVANRGGTTNRSEAEAVQVNRERPAIEADAAASSAGDPTRLAIFIGDVCPEVPDQKVDVLAAYLTSTLTSFDIEVIDRRDVLNAVSNLADAGTNRGTGDPSNTEVERLLSDQANVRSLAQVLGADGMMVATITSLEEDIRELNDSNTGVATKNIITTLSVSWKVLSGDTGGTIASDITSVREQIRQGRTLQRSGTSIDTLLRNAARTIGEDAQEALRRPAARRPVAADDAVVTVVFNIEMEDMNVPEIRKVDGEWTVSSNRYRLEPLSCEVLIDGFLVGTVPGEIEVSPGPHRVRIQRPGLVTKDQFMNIKPGMRPLSIPMQMTPDGRQRWMEAAKFFESLKTNAQLTEAEVGIAEGFKDFLKNSQVKINTENVQQIGGDNFWR